MRRRRRSLIPTEPTEDTAPIIGMDAELAQGIYRSLAKECHPDTGNGSHEEMASINANYNRLKAQPNTHLAFVLDNSGSMAPRRKWARRAFNNLLRRQAETWWKATYRLVTFTHQETGRPLSQAVPLTDETYQCSGGTPLYDTIAHTILAIDAEMNCPTDVIFPIITDGEECTSIEWRDPAKLAALIADHLARGWQFIYISCAAWGRAVAIEQATRIGIPAECATDEPDLPMLFSRVSEMLTSYQTGEVKRLTFDDQNITG